MGSRVRKRHVNHRGYFVKPEGEVTFSSGSYTTEYFAESSYPGSNNCYHYRFKPYTGFYVVAGGYPHYWENTTHLLPRPDSEFGTGMPLSAKGHRAMTALNWEKLPTSSKFGILQFLAELDDTLKTFTLKFWKSLSYGSFTWGVLPLVQDVQAVSETIANLSAGIGKLVPYEDEIKFHDTVDLVGVYDTYTCNSDVTVRQSGFVSYPDGTEILQSYDSFGFHPDLSTAWDLVPLSFVVDYLLPVGDWLDSLRHKGWCRTMNFSGWSTIRVRGVCTQTKWTGGTGFAPQPVEYDYFKRDKLSLILEIDDFPKQDPELFKLPSLKQMFNMLYIFVLSKKR